MNAAESIFLVYGLVILTYGFILGVPLAAVRIKAPQASRHLVTTHLSAIIQGAVHLGLASAVAMLEMEGGWIVTAAWLIVAGSVFEIIGGTINWLSGTEDQFAQKSLGFRLNSLVGPLAIIGIVIVAVGAFQTI